MADLISNIIDYEGVNSAIQLVIDKINALETKIDSANEKSLQIEVDAKGIDTLTEIVAMTKRQAEVVNQLSEAQQQNTKVVQENGNAAIQVATAVKESGVSLSNMAHIIITSQNEVKSLNSAIKLLSEILRGAEIRLGKLTESGKTNTREFANLTTNINNFRSELSELVPQSVDLQTKIDTLQSSLKIIGSSWEANTSLLSDNKVKADTLKAAITQLANAQQEANIITKQGNDLTAAESANIDVRIAESEKWASATIANYNSVQSSKLKYIEADQAIIEKEIALDEVATQKQIANELKKLEAAQKSERLQQEADQRRGLSLSLLRKRMVELQLAGQQESEEYELLRTRAIELADAQFRVAEATRSVEKATLSETAAQAKLEASMRRTAAATNFGSRIMGNFVRVAARFPAMLAEIAIFTALFEGISALWKSMTGTSEELVKVKDAISEFDLQLKELPSEINKVIEAEKLLNDTLEKTAQDSKLSFDVRIKSVNDLRTAYGHLLDMYSDVQIMNHNPDDNIDKKLRKADELKAVKENALALYNAQIKGFEDLEKLKLNDQSKLKELSQYQFYKRNDLQKAIWAINEKEINEGFVTGEKTSGTVYEGIRKRQVHGVYENVTPYDYNHGSIANARNKYEEANQGYNEYINDPANIPPPVKNIAFYKQQLSDLRKEMESSKLSPEIVQLIESGADDVKGTKLREILKKSPDEYTIKAENYRDQYKKLETEIKILEGEQDQTIKGRHRLGKLDPRLEGEKEYIDAHHALIQKELEQEALIQKDITDNVKEELGKRQAANLAYVQIQIDIAKNAADKEIALNELAIRESKNTIAEIKSGKGSYANYTSAQRDALINNEHTKQGGYKINEAATTQNMYAAIIKATEEGEKNIEHIIRTSSDEFVREQDELTEKEQVVIEEKYASQLISLNSMLNEKNITQEQYDTEEYNNQKEHDEALLKEHINYLLRLNNSNLYAGDRIANVKQIAVDRQSLAKRMGQAPAPAPEDLPTGAMPDLEEGFANLRKKTNDPQEQFTDQITAISNFSTQAINIYSTMYNAIKQKRDNAFAAEQQQLEIEMRMVKLQSDQQIQAINATVGFQITKDNEAAKVAAQTAAKQQEIQQQQNNLALKKAISDKKAAEAGIIMSTALAIAKTLPMLSNPITAAIGIAEIAIITAMGAAQYAAAASTPLPQFAAGGTVEQGTFIAGERGRELGLLPYGGAVMFDKPGIYTAPVGTIIKPHDETERLVRMAMNTMGVMPHYVEGPQKTMTDQRIVNELQGIRDELARNRGKQAPVKVVIEAKENRLQFGNKK